MKQFKTILDYEFKNYLKNKVFVGTTILFVVVIAVVMFFPRITAAFDKGDVSVSDSTQERPIMLVCADYPGTGAEGKSAVEQVFAQAFVDYEVVAVENKVDEINQRILSGEAECAFVLDSETSYKYYVNDLSMYDMNTSIADEVMLSIYRMSAMVAGGVPADQAQQILSVQINHEVERLGKDQMSNFFYTYIMVFALYMVILLYGQMVATNVATEKSTRAMELLVTSAKPTAMMFGKVIASCLAGLVQLLAIFGSAVLLYRVNASYWGDNEMISSIFAIPADLLLYMLLFFLLGFLVYAFLYGAIGSTASKLEDINTSVMPVTMLFIVGFFVVVFSISSGNIDNMLMKVCSFIPFTAPMAMFSRIAMSVVAPYEIIISVALLVVTVIGVGFISAKIYRVGVLLYGTKPGIASIIKAMRKA